MPRLRRRRVVGLIAGVDRSVSAKELEAAWLTVVSRDEPPPEDLLDECLRLINQERRAQLADPEALRRKYCSRLPHCGALERAVVGQHLRAMGVPVPTGGVQPGVHF